MPDELHLPMGGPKVHLFLHEDFDGLPVLVLRLEGDDDEMVEVGMHDWRVAMQWAVVMQYGALSLSERCGVDPAELRDVYMETVEWLSHNTED